MATNPMQKKARNSFILGMLVTFLFMALVVGFLLVQLNKMKDAEKEREAMLVKTYALNTDVKSGDTIDLSKLISVTIDKSAVPTNVVKSATLTENTIAKIDLTKGTVVTDSMVTESDSPLTDDLRVQEYNMISLASQLTSDDYIDVRLRMPSGEDYIVLSKKRLEIPEIGGIESVNTIWLKLTEDETLTMASAIVDAYKVNGSLLYTTRYVEPGTQTKATPTYSPSAEVIQLINKDPNVVQEAKAALINRYNDDGRYVRNRLDSEVSKIEEDDRISGVQSGTTKEISTTLEQRKSYLDALAGN